MNSTPRKRASSALPLLLSLLAVPFSPALAQESAATTKPKVLQLPMRTAGPGSLDPVQGSTTYDNRACSLVYETLLQYKYLKRHGLELEPLLLTKMPEASADKKMWSFELKEGVRFHDDPCFPGGKGRVITSRDVFYSMKRMADKRNNPRSWWLYENTIVGFDAYKKEQSPKDSFDYNAEVAGMKILDDRHFEIHLTEPVYRFLYILAMFQTSVVPREAVEKYGVKFGEHPVGTGPFIMRPGDWISGKSLTFYRNPNYHECYYPTEADEDLVAKGMLAAKGKRLPIADKVEITMFTEDNPMWLEFKAGKLDYTQVPSENFPEAFRKRSRKLKRAFRKKGFTYRAEPLLDFIFRGFNMQDEVLGGYTAKKRALRRAFALAVDFDEFNETFYNGQNVVYDGCIPPGLVGYPKDGRSPIGLRGPDLDKARALMAEAGYPGGKGLPEIEYWTSRGSNGPEQTELLKRQLSKIGVRLRVRLVDFAPLIAAINNKKAQFFSFALSSDYPDGENKLALCYGPHASPGSNHYNYKNAEFDKLYERIRSMAPSKERTIIYERMRDIVIEDMPFLGSMARTRYYLISPALKNFVPTEDFANWPKYLDVDESKRNQL